MKIENLPFSEIPDTFGIVLLGAGGDLQEWIDGVSGILFDEKIVQSRENVFVRAIKIKDNVKGENGRSDLVLEFNKDNPPNIVKLALWRLRFGDCSWLDDFKINYCRDYISGEQTAKELDTEEEIDIV